MTKLKLSYLKQKILLYFDENFPQTVVQGFKDDKNWKKRCKIHSAYDFGNRTKDDQFHFDFCKTKGFTLVTLDDDFMDDSKYPFSKISGIIKIKASKNEVRKIKICLNNILDFLSVFPRPRQFIGDTKFQVSTEGCVIRGRDAYTGEVKSIFIAPGDTVGKIGKSFGYFP